MSSNDTILSLNAIYLPFPFRPCFAVSFLLLFLLLPFAVAFCFCCGFLRVLLAAVRCCFAMSLSTTATITACLPVSISVTRLVLPILSLHLRLLSLCPRSAHTVISLQQRRLPPRRPQMWLPPTVVPGKQSNEKIRDRACPVPL